jgi:hypothetical protein
VRINLFWPDSHGQFVIHASANRPAENDREAAMSESDPGIYSKAVVTYVDILGFADLITESRANASKISQIAGMLTTMKEEFSTGGRTHRDSEGRKKKIFDSFNFSDLVVRTTRLPADANIAEFIEWELFYIASKQLDLALESVLVRGGICIEDIFVSSPGSIVFGPGIVKSYKLESQYAVYPRILVDRNLIWKADEDGSIETWRDYVRQGEDGAYFVDYLFACSVAGLLFLNADGPDVTQQIEMHRDVIQRLIKQPEIHTKDERIKQKYIWLALYHNATIKRLLLRFLKALPPRIADLTIPERLLDF